MKLRGETGWQQSQWKNGEVNVWNSLAHDDVTMASKPESLKAIRPICRKYLYKSLLIMMAK